MWPNLTVYNGKILFFIKELCFYNANTVMAACRSKATSVQKKIIMHNITRCTNGHINLILLFSANFFIFLNNIQFFNFV